MAGTRKRSPDKFDKPSLTDRVLYKVAQAQTAIRKKLRRKKPVISARAKEIKATRLSRRTRKQLSYLDKDTYSDAMKMLGDRK